MTFLYLYFFRIRSWLYKASRPDFYLERLQKIVDFALMELENRRLLYEPSTSGKGNLSCKFTIAEIDNKGSLLNEPIYASQQIEQKNNLLNIPSAKIITNKTKNVRFYLFYNKLIGNLIYKCSSKWIYFGKEALTYYWELIFFIINILNFFIKINFLGRI